MVLAINNAGLVERRRAKMLAPCSWESLDNNLAPLLARLRGGDAAAGARVFELAYTVLKRMARRALAGDRSSLNTTGLVNEAFLKLFREGPPSWEDRAHFLGTAAKAMRHIVIDAARRRRAQKRVPIPEALKDLLTACLPVDGDILDLNAALLKLADRDPELVRVVEMRFFAGFSIEETSRVLDISPRSVVRAWEVARAWLQRELGGG